MSRRLSQGERSHFRRGLQNDTQNYNRVTVGQIASVNTRNGTMSVALSTGQKLTMVIPIGGLSAQGFKSSWFRYMPQTGDFVKVGFDLDNRPHALGMAAWGHEEDVGNPSGRAGSAGYHIGGYATLSKLREQNAPGLREFEELQQGEWDLRSAGSAYIKGSREGTLLLSGGRAKIELDRQRYEQRSRSGLFEWSDRGASLRFGDTKRSTVPGASATALPPAPALPWKEWELKVHQEVAPGLTNKFYEERKGIFDLVPGTGTPVPGPNGVPVHYEQVVFDGTFVGTEVYREHVDALGNRVEDFGALATIHSQSGGPLTAWNTDYLISELHTTTVNALTSSQALGGILLGSTAATESYLMGTTWAPYEITRSTALAASHTGMSTNAGFMIAAMTTLAAFLTSYSTIVSPPPAPDGVAAAAAATAVAATIAAWTAQVPLAATAAATNTSLAAAAVPSPAGFLSAKIFGE